MGSCMTRLQAEMKTPTPNSGNWEGLAPQRPQEYVVPRQQQRQRTEKGTNGAPLARKETPSGIPGLTYDQAGRPVWREENAVKAELVTKKIDNTL